MPFDMRLEASPLPHHMTCRVSRIYRQNAKMVPDGSIPDRLKNVKNRSKQSSDILLKVTFRGAPEPPTDHNKNKEKSKNFKHANNVKCLTFSSHENMKILCVVCAVASSVFPPKSGFSKLETHKSSKSHKCRRAPEIVRDASSHFFFKLRM